MDFVHYTFSNDIQTRLLINLSSIIKLEYNLL